MSTVDTGGRPVESPGQDPRPGDSDRVRTVVRGLGEFLITAGLVVLLFVVYEVYVTDLLSAGKQREATAALDSTWAAPAQAEQERVEHFDGLAEGAGFAKMYVPVLGADYSFTILEGTTDKTLEVGPGHYPSTAFPGQPGNFAVAGHRVGKGAPFNDIDLLNSCDAIVVETRYSWFVYRVLPKKDEVGTWSTGKAADPRCTGVAPLGAPYNEVVGQQIVSPKNSAPIAPIPGMPGAETSVGEQVTLMTLTTCHPRFSDRERLIVHAVMVKQWAKDPAHADVRPPELKETA
ncbi:FIG054872: Sortase-like protein [Alloactinosynnema sp. L-07]|uniref:class E sortase n=1 Tax=Alloactinosynnema sp. L-07 TaxID=1653480 RepID=UPI00065F016A|nr:class E sortase [Alloactinosynnema sp. L-07]CRK60733.1 FIG054872: Sortase-like protein [Alloactinosynnema sp. L-07]